MLDKQQIRHLRGRAQALTPVVMIGQKGLSEPVREEIRIALRHHELIKIRIGAGNRESRRKMAERIIGETGAEQIQAIGNILVLFLRNPDRPRIPLPGGKR